jgi:gliding motility-associated protein GldC
MLRSFLLPPYFSRMKSSEIKFQIDLDENKVPERIHWEASEAGINAEAKAMILSVWDKKEQNTLRIDLWTKEMQVDEMKQFVHQTILTLADNFEKSTGEKIMAETMRDFCGYFAEKMNLLPPM